jgi:hypothetical protein
MHARLVHAAIGLVLAASAGIALAQEPVKARPAGSAFISIRPGIAMVRESFEVNLPARDARLHIPDIPAAAIDDGLQLFDTRRELKLNSWTRATSSPEHPIALTPDNNLNVRFDQPGGAMQKGGLEIQVSARTAGPKRFDLVYPVTGLTWRATYDVLVRGSLTNLADAASVDVDGLVEVINNTGRAYDNVRLEVIGPDTLGEPPARKLPGILDLLDFHPMADRWLFRLPDPLTPQRYPVGDGIALPAGRSSLLAYVSARRRPVEQRLMIRAGDIPTDTRGPGAAPSLLVTFANNDDYAGGRPTPPGEAVIHVGNRSGSIYQRAWFKHTPVDGEIRIDLGRIEGVFARRVDRGATPRPDGGSERVYEIRIDNRTPQRARMIIEESPPLTASWQVLRSSIPHQFLNRRLVFTPDLPPRIETVLNYTLRVTGPSL